MSAPASKKRRASNEPAAHPQLGIADAGLIALVMMIALAQMSASGTRRGAELLPWPDGLEYAATAVNLDRGMGPVLHFGGYSYPSRYTLGYPLILAAALPLVRWHVERLELVTIATGLGALAALYILGLRIFGRSSAFFASLILAASPVFITNSTLVLSDVPTLAVAILAALAIVAATDTEDDAAAGMRCVIWWSVFAMLAGFAIIIRPTNATMLIGLGAGLIAAPPRRITLTLRTIGALAAIAAAFAIIPAWQAWQNYAHLGSFAASGYVFWVPEVYGSFFKTFNAAFLAGPTMPRNPHGNLAIYLPMLAGLDGLVLHGWFGETTTPAFYLYPFAAAAFAMIGFIAWWRQPAAQLTRASRRVVFFGLGFLASILGVYALYFFNDPVFLLPASFVLFLMAGHGVMVANRPLFAASSSRREHRVSLPRTVAVVALDVILALSILATVARRIEARPRESEIVPALAEIASRLPAHAIVMSNLSLQFLELYMPPPGRQFVGMHSFESDSEHSDYHLSRLYARRDQGWRGALPQVAFDGDHENTHTIAWLADEARAGTPVFMLLRAPVSSDYAHTLGDETRTLEQSFDVVTDGSTGLLGLFRLRPR
jgi:hypothetical protein